MNAIRAVLFDLDDTLIDRTAAFLWTVDVFYDSHPFVRATRSRTEVRSLLVRWDDDGYTERTKLFELVLEAWPQVGGTVPELVEWYRWTLRQAIRQDTHVLTLLTALSEAGIPWGIVTNGSEFQRGKMASAGLADIAPFVVVSEEIGFWKPAPEIFEEALSRLNGLAPENVLFVGDNPETDIRGAQGVGMPTAWLRGGRSYPEGQPQPDFQIDHVEELALLLLPDRPPSSIAHVQEMP